MQNSDIPLSIPGVAMDCPVRFTTRAASEVRDIMSVHGKGRAALRLHVVRGGCAGLEYGLAIDTRFDPAKDRRFTDPESGLPIILDAMTLQYASGSMVDWVPTSMGGAFRVDNPNAARTCGCGSSFATSDYAGPTLTDGCRACPTSAGTERESSDGMV